MAGLVGLVHPNIVGVLDAGVSDQSAYAALEPWAGDLRSVFHGRNEPPPSGAALVEGLYAGLAAAHRAGFVHGDLDAIAAL